MRRRPRYRTGDPELDAAIGELVEKAGAENSDLVFELVVSAVRMARDHADRGDLKIANAALKEMRYAFHVFAPYRSERKLAIFGSARTQPDSPLYEQTRRLALAMAAHDWMVITGAGPGIMEAGLEGAGPDNAFGVSIRLPFEAATSQFISGDPKLINFRYFFTRKLEFVKESHGFVLLPGGFGTMDETFELLTLVQTGKTEPAPIVLLDVPGGTFWASWRDFVERELVANGYIGKHDLNLMSITDDVEQTVDEVIGFYTNYHSQRYVEGVLVLRLLRAPDDAELEALNHEFADIVVRGRIERIEATAAERAEDDHVDLERIAFRFDRHNYARLRELIDRLNGREPRPAEPTIS
jgi:uncharacterized protein (TIGR00730 family)